jgi:serine/threonine protein kinase
MTGNWKQWEGQVVNGKFLLRQYLGGSDHSAVYLTEISEQETRKAAIKLIPTDSADAELYLSRLIRATQLTHLHLMKLYEAGRCQVGPRVALYIVMEYAEEDLSQILPERPLTPAEARDMLEPVLDALTYLHREGFVHGHIKPANILVVDEQIRISCDGLFPMNESSGSPGEPGAYDPPEASSGKVSPAWDVWALGITLAEALTQHIPVREKTEQGAVAVSETLPAPFLDLISHCLHPDPQRRSTLADIALRVKPPSPLPPIQATASAGPSEIVVKRRPIVLWLAVVLGLAAILAISSFIHRRSVSQPDPSHATEPQVVQTNPEQKTVIPETGQPTKRPTDETESSGVPPSPPGSPQSEGVPNKPAGGWTRGEVLQQVLPEVPQNARDTIQGKVKVNVNVAVDPSGSVVKATVDSQGQSKYFANLALKASHDWKFGPAKLDGRAVSSQWLLRFEFERTGTKVIPKDVTP